MAPTVRVLSTGTLECATAGLGRVLRASMATAHLCLKCWLPLYRRTAELGSFSWLAPFDLLLIILLLPKEDLVLLAAFVMVTHSEGGGVVAATGLSTLVSYPTRSFSQQASPFRVFAATHFLCLLRLP